MAIMTDPYTDPNPALRSALAEGVDVSNVSKDDEQSVAPAKAAEDLSVNFDTIAAGVNTVIPVWKESAILNLNNPEFKLWIINDDVLFKPNLSIEVDVTTFVVLMSKFQKPEVNILGGKKIQYIYKSYVDIKLILKLDIALNNYIKRKIDALLISKGDPAGEEAVVSIEAFQSLMIEKITCCEFLKNLTLCGLDPDGGRSKCFVMFEVVEQEQKS